MSEFFLEKDSFPLVDLFSPFSSSFFFYLRSVFLNIILSSDLPKPMKFGKTFE